VREGDVADPDELIGGDGEGAATGGSLPRPASAVGSLGCAVVGLVALLVLGAGAGDVAPIDRLPDAANIALFVTGFVGGVLALALGVWGARGPGRRRTAIAGAVLGGIDVLVSIGVTLALARILGTLG
jgi:hypothetical protein